MGQRILAPVLMVVSGLSLYAGAALALGLFEVLPPAIVAWFRILAAGIILVALRRPPLDEFFGYTGAVATAFGLVTLAMNMVFYEAIAYLPLGTAVAIEFFGPIVVAAWGSRSVSDWLALLLAGGGVMVISGAQWAASAYGVVFALLAAALWAIYIVIGSKVARNQSKYTLAVGFWWAGVLAAPVMVWFWPAGGTGLPWWQLMGLAAGLGFLSALIPYSLDQVILKLTGAAYFAVLLALLPLTAALLGVIVLGQTLSGAEIVGIAAVVIAVAIRKA